MSNETKPFWDKKKVLALLILFLTITLLIVHSNSKVESIPKNKTQFALASWTFPDNYGQGIEAFEIYENSTGSWVLTSGAYGYEDNYNIDIYANGSIKLRCYTWFNSTLTGASDTNDGKNFQQHNVTVINMGTTIFSQQNFTWFYDDDSINPPMWYYGYEVVLNFLPLEGQVYTVTVTYEVYY